MVRVLVGLLWLALAATGCAMGSEPVPDAGRSEADAAASVAHEAGAEPTTSGAPPDSAHVALMEAPPPTVASDGDDATASGAASGPVPVSGEEAHRRDGRSCGYYTVPDETYYVGGLWTWADSLDFGAPPTGVFFAELVQLMPVADPFAHVDGAGSSWWPDWPLRWQIVRSGLVLDEDRCMSVSSAAFGSVVLPVEFSVECVGRVAAVVHGNGEAEFGDAANAVWLAADGAVTWRQGSSPELAAAIEDRHMDVAFVSAGDAVSVAGAGSLLVRSPPWPQSPGWEVQTLRAGPLLLLTAQPAHLECFSGVTWAFDVSTGEMITCGANTMATAVVRTDASADGFGAAAGRSELWLPDPDDVPDYLECAARFDLGSVERRLS